MYSSPIGPNATKFSATSKRPSKMQKLRVNWTLIASRLIIFADVFWPNWANTIKLNSPKLKIDSKKVIFLINKALRLCSSLKKPDFEG